MTIQPFELLEPRTIHEALDVLSGDPDVRPLAGGTALVILMKQGLVRPARVLNLKKIADHDGLAWDPDGTLRIGAMTAIGRIERDPEVAARLPGLARACHVVANVRIRNLATLGGNLAHADYQSDPPAMLTALGARILIRSADGDREEAIEDFQVGGYETTLHPGELITGIVVPPQSDGVLTTYEKFTSRSAEDRPCAGIAVRYRAGGGRCQELRLVVGAVSPTPVRVTEAEALAVGQTITADLATEIGRVAAAAVDPIDDLRGSVAYKRHLVAVLARRAMTAVASEAKA
jgi:carbon-monoxide dehydrogenase medium subunit